MKLRCLAVSLALVLTVAVAISMCLMIIGPDLPLIFATPLRFFVTVVPNHVPLTMAKRCPDACPQQMDSQIKEFALEHGFRDGNPAFTIYKNKENVSLIFTRILPELGVVTISLPGKIRTIITIVYIFAASGTFNDWVPGSRLSLDRPTDLRHYVSLAT